MSKQKPKKRPPAKRPPAKGTGSGRPPASSPARPPARRAAPPSTVGRWWPAIVAAIVVVGVIVVAVSRNGSGSASTTATTVAASDDQLLAPVNDPKGVTIDGIKCEPSESVLFHIHAHLGVFVNDQPRGIPAGIGIQPPRQEQSTADGPFVVGGSCFYWLHSHTQDGVIHIESPIERTYTLGNYFDVWQQPLSPTTVGPFTGTVTAFVDGKPFTGNPRDIPLTAHGLIQLNVDSTIGPQPFTFASGL